MLALSTPAFAAAELEGLLSVPGLFDPSAPDSLELKVRSKPDQSSSVVATLKKDGIYLGKVPKSAACYWESDCPTLRHEPGERSLLVVTRGKSDFFEIVLAGGKTGWIHSETRYRPLSELVTRPFAYLTAAWDGQLYSEAGALAAIQLGRPEGALIGVKVKGATELRGQTWIELEVFPVGACDTADGEDEAVGHGWVKAAGSATAPNVWNALDCP